MTDGEAVKLLQRDASGLGWVGGLGWFGGVC